MEEGLLAMRGCWRLLWRDPAAFEDFNLTIEGFWRSFAMLVPAMILVYPIFIAAQRLSVELAQAGESPPDYRLSAHYGFLLASVVVWLVASALLARLLGVAQNYVRYMIIYNWMTVPVTLIAVIPYLLYLATGATSALILGPVIYGFGLYVSWYVARVGLETTALIASVFMLAEFVLSSGLDMLAW